MTAHRSLPRTLVLLLVTSVLAALLVGVSSSSASARPSPENDHATMPRKCVAPKDLIPQDPTVCLLNDFQDDRSTVVLWGDSHAWMMIPALRRATGKKDLNMVAVVLGGCPPMDNRIQPDDKAPSCFKSNDMAIRFVREVKSSGQGLRVILAGSWQRYLHALKVHDQTYTGTMAREMRTATPRLMRTLAGIGVGVDVVGQVATVPEKRAACKKNDEPYACDLTLRQAMPEKKATRKWLNDTIRPLAGNRAPIDVTSYFCSKTTCHGMVGKTYTWWDDLHLSASMSQRLFSFLRAPVEKAVADHPTKPEPEEPGCTVPILGIPC